MIFLETIIHSYRDSPRNFAQKKYNFYSGLIESLNRSFIFVTHYFTKTLAHPDILHKCAAKLLLGSGEVLLLDYNVGKALNVSLQRYKTLPMRWEFLVDFSGNHGEDKEIHRSRERERDRSECMAANSGAKYIDGMKSRIILVAIIV